MALKHERLAATTWNLHVSVLSCFYQWAMAEGYVGTVPFSYAQAQVRYGAVTREMQVNLARRRTPKPHVTVRYLEADFAALFIAALGGRCPGTDWPTLAIAAGSWPVTRRSGSWR